MTHRRRTRKSQNHFGAFVLGGLIGGACGAIAALLSAPQPGWKTRQQVQEAGLALKADVEEKVEEGKQAIERTVAQARENVNGRFEQMSGVAHTVVENERMAG